MKLALSIWNQRIAPVFDSSRTVMILDVVNGEYREEDPLDLGGTNLELRAQRLEERGVQELICGAISCEAEQRVAEREIRLHPFIAGSIDSVLQGWQQQNLEREEFSMPGCACACRRRAQHRRRMRNNF